MRRIDTACLYLLVLVGCQEAPPPGQPADSKSAAGVTVSLPGPGSENDRTNSNVAAAAEDNPQTLLRLIRDLRQHPLPEDPADARVQNRQRHEQIIQIATEIVQLSIAADSDDLVNDALRERLESRLQLALTGNADDIRKLYADARTLEALDPKSDATAEAIYTLARFAHAMAAQHDGNERDWLGNFARWSREFSTRFSDQASRAVALLLSSAQSCEQSALHLPVGDDRLRLIADARLSYTLLAEKFSETSEGAAAAGALRRLLDLQDLQGRVVLIYFWESSSPEFTDHLLPLLKQAEAAGGDRLRLIGVCLDPAGQNVAAYAAENAVPGLQLRFPAAEQQGWENPIARYWGISVSPDVWILNENGIVTDVGVGYQQLVARVRAVFD